MKTPRWESNGTTLRLVDPQGWTRVLLWQETGALYRQWCAIGLIGTGTQPFEFCESNKRKLQARMKRMLEDWLAS